MLQMNVLLVTSFVVIRSRLLLPSFSLASFALASGFPLPFPSADDAPWTLLGGKAGENASLALHLICAPQENMPFWVPVLTQQLGDKISAIKGSRKIGSLSLLIQTSLLVIPCPSVALGSIMFHETWSLPAAKD